MHKLKPKRSRPNTPTPFAGLVSHAVDARRFSQARDTLVVCSLLSLNKSTPSIFIYFEPTGSTYQFSLKKSSNPYYKDPA
jgi:hypothetical protein